ncbi:TPA: hypothetical protein N0F65_003078 [Lagenidium giganteum]|uniref:Reverse transcriptase Ty1/copia-type domain-containing protein n=1 Tax=Lagenidium giganteum TaxID=4803 RepID=A0AAV2YM54_9STRA|nr:TPA: hypothetical protein N0F65_003078 [Lagenidium giganteum]
MQRGWQALQYDVKTAFLYGPLDVDIYIQRPDGFEEGDNTIVCKLERSLYGLRQAPYVSNQTLHAKRSTLGFTRIEKDCGLYAVKEDSEIKILITVYANDLVLIGPGDLCNRVAMKKKDDFQLTSLGEVKVLLGVEINIDRQQKRITFSQRQYIKEILLRFHMATCNGAKTPEPSTVLQGALGYLVAGTRPDIAHAVRRLGQFLAKFDVTHYALGKHVLWYLKSTVDYGLVMDVKMDRKVALALYTDADYANDPVDRKSISG